MYEGREVIYIHFAMMLFLRGSLSDKKSREVKNDLTALVYSWVKPGAASSCSSRGLAAAEATAAASSTCRICSRMTCVWRGGSGPSGAYTRGTIKSPLSSLLVSI